MKKLSYLFAFVLFLSIFSSCEKDENYGKATFYVRNAGDKQVADHISVEIGDLVDNFFTPEGRNMSLSGCTDGASNAAYFEIPAGTYNYKATGGRGKWSGTFTIKDNECKIVELSY